MSLLLAPLWLQPAVTPAATAPLCPWAEHPTLTALRASLQITADCWNLLAAPDGSSRKQEYLPQGEREPQSAYDKRLAAARPSGFLRDALRTYAGMLSRGSWLSLPAQLSAVLTDVDGRGTDLGVFLASADLLVLRDGAALVLVLPPEHSWPSEGDRQEALGASACPLASTGVNDPQADAGWRCYDIQATSYQGISRLSGCW